MEGKTKKKRKVLKVLLVALSFVLTIVVTASVTLAWFYDSDWASDQVTMAGAVGIEMRDESKLVTSGAGGLHFIINDETTNGKAYPGQAIEMEASVFNNGGTSVTSWWQSQPGYTEGSKPTDTQIQGSGAGSACFVRANFKIYTNVGVEDDITDYDTTGWTQAEKDQLAIEIQKNKEMNAQALYEFLVDLIDEQNTKYGTTYKWIFWRNSDARMTINSEKYFAGSKTESATAQPDEGYFYLCQPDGETLYQLTVGGDATFLWNGTFIIPWQLTNLSADKHIFIGLSFQAIQTFIPRIDSGTINPTLANNQLPFADCKYNNISVQTVFNSSWFRQVSPIIDGFDYSDDTKGFVPALYPEDHESKTGTAVANPTLS
ncbi:MAG: hypothetical protein E7356_03820 [Clostridiales bacterium]|nr:hypothetical protein [Clostridiales bacterium]